MANTNQDAALRKRQLIARANKTMFMWVALASAIVGISAVILFSLAQHLWFNQKVLGEMYKTIDNLKANNKNAEEIKKNVRVLNTNQTLLGLRVPGEDEPVQVVLDALPARANSAALGASLQSDKLLAQPGIMVESLNVDPSGDETSSSSSSSATSTTATTENTIQFKFTIIATGGPEAQVKLKSVLQALERSIRGIKLSKVDIEIQGDKTTMNAIGNGFYQPGKKIELGTKSVSPKETPKTKRSSKK